MVCKGSAQDGQIRSKRVVGDRTAGEGTILDRHPANIGLKNIASGACQEDRRSIFLPRFSSLSAGKGSVFNGQRSAVCTAKL